MKSLYYIIVLSFILNGCSKKGIDGLDKDPDNNSAKIEKVTSVASKAGRNRLELSWREPANLGEIKLSKYRVFWNTGKDSLEVPAKSTTADSVLVMMNLEEGSYVFSIYAYDNSGNKSTAASGYGRTYGSQYEAGLLNRKMNDMYFDPTRGAAVIAWDAAIDGALYTEVNYEDNASVQKTKKILVDEMNTYLDDSKVGSMISYRTAFVPQKNAIDTFYTEPNLVEIKAEREIVPKLLWDGNALLGNSIWKVATNIEGTGTISVINDPTYGAVWKMFKPLGSHRTETHAAKGFQAQEGDDIYIGWRSKLTMPKNIGTNSVFQWKAYGADMQQNFPIIFSTSTDGSLQLLHYAPGGTGTVLWKAPLTINVWNRFVLRLKISRDGSVGFIEFWYNDVKQTLVRGTERYYSRTLDAEYCDPKWGVYGGDKEDITNFVGGLRIATTYELAKPEHLQEPAPEPVPEPAPAPKDPPSIILNKPMKASSALSTRKAEHAVDDDMSTYWQALGSDRDDNNTWLSADIGSAKPFNGTSIYFNRVDVIASYQILYSDDGTNWKVAFEKKSGFSTMEKASFPTVTARHVKLNLNFSKDGNMTIDEWRIY